MQYAPVLPLELVGVIETPYQIAFAEHVLMHAWLQEYYQTVPAHVLMDTLVYEGGWCSWHEWMRAVQLIHPSVAVVPDVRDDAEATIRNVEEALAQGLDRDTQLCGAVQGLGDAYLECAWSLAELVPWLGFTAHRVEGENTNRADVIYELTEQGLFDKHPDLKIHLLGSSALMFEDAIALKDHPNVIGVDSAKAVSAGIYGVKIDSPLYSIQTAHRPDKFFDLHVKTTRVIRHNIREVYRWLS